MRQEAGDFEIRIASCSPNWHCIEWLRMQGWEEWRADPVKTGKIVFAINGNKVPFDAEMIPKLFVAYVAAIRAEYYAGVDAARGDDFATVFHEEIRHAMRDRSELVDWLENNMDWHTEKADEIGVLYEVGGAVGRCASGEEKGASA